MKVASRQKSARLNPIPEDMPGEEEKAEEGMDTNAMVQQLLARIQAMEAAASNGGPAPASPVPSPTAGPTRQIRYGLSNVQKFDAYTKQAHAVSLMLSGLSKTHPVGATRENNRQLVEGFERKGLGMPHSR